MKKLPESELKKFLDEKTEQYNHLDFIDKDPVKIPHLFSEKSDIEISGFLTSVISWGQREMIIKNAVKLMEWMDNSPHQFICNYSRDELKIFQKFYYRTFKGEDCIFFLQSLKNIYSNYGGLQTIFEKNILKEDENVSGGIIQLKKFFFELPHQKRTEKHLPDIIKNAAAKRMNMFLRWMVRSDDRGVDFGIWKKIKTAQLVCPLDVHTARVARKLGLLKRKQNDWQSAIELTNSLKKFDSKDPVKYDYALFGLGIFEKF